MLIDGAGEDSHLLVSDIVMPGMSGVQLLRAARARKPGMPVLLMTGYSDGVLDALEAIDRPDGLLDHAAGRRPAPPRVLRLDRFVRAVRIARPPPARRSLRSSMITSAFRRRLMRSPIRPPAILFWRPGRLPCCTRQACPPPWTPSTDGTMEFSFRSK